MRVRLVFGPPAVVEWCCCSEDSLPGSEEGGGEDMAVFGVG